MGQAAYKVIYYLWRFIIDLTDINYEWAKLTKFLLTVIHGSPRQHSNSSKTFKKYRKKLKYIFFLADIKRWTGSARPDSNREILTQSPFKSPICLYLWYFGIYALFGNVEISVIFSSFSIITFDWNGHFELWWFHLKDLIQI